MKTEDIIAYVDGELSADEVARMDAELAERPELVEALTDVCLQRFLLDDVLRSETAADVQPSAGRANPWLRVGVPLAFAASLVLAAGMWWATGTPQASDYNLKSATGAVKYAGWNQIGAGESVPAGRSIVFGRESSSELVNKKDGSVITVNGAARLELNDGCVNLESGDLLIRIAEQNAGSHFVVNTPHSVLTVVGTVFQVKVSPKGTGVSVSEGKVKMQLVGAGQGLVIPAGRDAFAAAGASVINMPGRKLKQKLLADLGYSDAPGVAHDGKSLILWCVKTDPRNGHAVLQAGLLVMDPDTLAIHHRVRLDEEFEERSRIAWDGEYLWGFNKVADALIAVDLKSGRVVRTVRVPDPLQRGRYAFAVGGGFAWMVKGSDLLKLSLRDGQILERKQVDVKFDQGRLCWADGKLYAGEWRGAKVAILDPGNMKVVGRFETDRVHFYGGDMALDSQRGLWVSSWGQIYLFEGSVQ